MCKRNIPGISTDRKNPSSWKTGVRLIFIVNSCWLGGLGAARTLQWRHNERNVVSNDQPHDCLLNRLFRRRSKKTLKLRVTGLCEGNSPVTGEFPHEGPVTWKMLPVDDVIMESGHRQQWYWPMCLGIFHSYLNPLRSRCSEVRISVQVAVIAVFNPNKDGWHLVIVVIVVEEEEDNVMDDTMATLGFQWYRN